MKLSLLLKPEHVFISVPARTREEILVYVTQRLEDAGTVRHPQDIVDLLLDRERLGPTVVGDEIAIPHCKVPGLKTIVAAFARSIEPIQFGVTEGEQARLFFFVLSPREQPAAHLQVLANIARLLRNPSARKAFLDATSVEELLTSLARFEATP